MAGLQLAPGSLSGPERILLSAHDLDRAGTVAWSRDVSGTPAFSDSAAPHERRDIAESFGAEAERYDRARPSYPKALTDAIAADLPGRSVLDVGIGTGISSRQLRDAGFDVLGVDADSKMADVARQHGFTVEVARFEDWDPAGRRFDAVIAGQTWHWVDPDRGATKAAEGCIPVADWCCSGTSPIRAAWSTPTGDRSSCMTRPSRSSPSDPAWLNLLGVRRILTVLTAGVACLLASCSNGSSGSSAGSTSASTSALLSAALPSTSEVPTSAASTPPARTPAASVPTPSTTRSPAPTSRSTGSTRSTSSPVVSRTTTPRPSTGPSPTTAAPTGTQIVTATSQFGDILFDAKKQAIYLFAAEDSTTPACYDECAVAWPPVLTDGKPRAGGTVDPKLLGTTPRSDGSTQVTYGGHPLYYYAHEGPDEVTCHNVDEYGGLWLVVKPNGVAVGS